MQPKNAVCYCLYRLNQSVLDPNAAMRSLVKHTHYMDEKWRGRCHTYDVRDNFLQLYRFKLELFCMELISVVFSPLILCFSLPKSAHRIVNFIDTFSVDTSKEEGGGQGAGHVLGYSLFDFARFGDAKYVADSFSRIPERVDGFDIRLKIAFSSERGVLL